MPHIFSIPSGEPFIPTLAAGLKASPAGDFQRALVLLPTRRACTALRDHFLHQEMGNDGAMLLPTIRQLSTVEDDALLITGDAELAQAILDLPPAIAPMRRRLLLTKLIQAKKEPEISHTQAFLLAGDLGRLMDQVLIEKCDFKNLAALVDGELAIHWEITVSFLNIISEHWPRILKEQGMIEAVDRRQRLVYLLIDHWQKKPPDFPVIAAGSTGSHPATADMLKTIAALPKGAVILPGLDTVLDEESWQGISPTHPQYQLKKLLKHLDVERENVNAWAQSPTQSQRSELVFEIMRPAENSDQWQKIKSVMLGKKPWEGLETMTAAHEQQEAMVAALKLRFAAECGDKTAALITPDRTLAARVAAIMRRWNIVVDDSAGVALSQTPLASFFVLLLNLFKEDLKPSEFMALLKHPETTLDMGREQCLKVARLLEMDFFRDSIKGQGLPNWLTTIKNDEDYSKPITFVHKQIFPIHTAETKDFTFWIDAHLALAKACSSNVLWQGAQGEAMANYFDMLMRSVSNYPCSFDDYVGIFKEGLKQETVRTSFGQHPDIHILGLIEARMLSFDTVILAGLNEGVWPENAAQDPWMSQAMRVKFGLPDPDQHIGQTAHDFVQLLAGQNVTLLRSERRGETPTIPSRWLLRLDTVLKMLGQENSLEPTQPWLLWAHDCDRPETIEPRGAPAVHVDVKSLPEKLSASDIELWVRDPYAFYAKRVLKLNALGSLDAEMGARERGNIFHKALDSVARQFNAHWPAEAKLFFLKALYDGFALHGGSVQELHLMQPRLEILAEKYWHFEKERRAQILRFYSEKRGEIRLNIAGYQPLLHARADRLDILPDETLAITDYKTGARPKDVEVELALKPQLLVEAIIGAGKGYDDVSATQTTALRYIQLGEGEDLIKPHTIEVDKDSIEKIHRVGLEDFISAFLEKDAVFHSAPRPFILPPAQDYARLARVAEWSKGEIDQEDADS